MIGFSGRIEQLNRAHNRRQFNCGDSALNHYLQRYARQHADANISRSYVAVDQQRLCGYYSLAMAEQQLPNHHQHRFADYPVPIARLARLAVDIAYQGKDIGKLLLLDALHRCLQMSQTIGMTGVIVDAKHEQAKVFYLNFEFETFPDAALTLWLPTAAIKTLFTAD
ncbi:MAG: GNAT family N-acetyltransferase [Methylococcales bacterium]